MDSRHDRTTAAPDAAGPLIGSWVRTGERVGLLARVADGHATVFFPGERRMATAPLEEVQPVPAGAVRVTASVDLPLAHGLGEELLRRWAATLLDGTLRDRAAEALRDAGLDVGAALPQMSVEIAAADVPGALCLCGAVTPTTGDTGGAGHTGDAGGAVVPCARCGRAAAPPPAGSADGVRGGV